MSSARFIALMAGLLFALVAAIATALGVGAVGIPLDTLLMALQEPSRLDESTRVILYDLRLPRVVLATLIGAGLAAAGAAYQGLFRNPLADPFVIGASSGAALGAAIAVTAGLTWQFAGLGGVPLAAFCGTILAVAIVFALGGIGPRASALTLLLAGAAISTVLGAMVSLIMIVNDQSLQIVFSWLLGGLSGRGWDDVQLGAWYILPGMVWVLTMARPLDALILGDDTARSLGLSLNASRALIVAAASLTTAATVSIGGIIGFIGLLAPHTARMLFGVSHVRLIPAAALMGAILLVLADCVARTAFAPIEVPVGIMTAMMGGPFFLYVLKTRGATGIRES